MKTSCRLTIFEGPDGSGKTTAAKKFAAKTDAEYVHFGAFPNTLEISRLYAEAMLPAVLGHRDVVFDRSWYDEKPYGAIFRNGADRVKDPGRRMLARLAMRCGAIVVICAPPWERCRDNYLSRKHLEYLDNEAQLKYVYDYFTTTADISPLHYPYDYTKDQDLTLGELERMRFPRHPLAIRSAGNWGASWVLVGESFGEQTRYDLFYQWPFASFSHIGCSWWLAEQLASACVPEHGLLWANADQDLDLIPRPTRRHFVALGDRAARRLEELKLPFYHVEHPQHHKRFHFNTRYNLLGLLEDDSCLPQQQTLPLLG